MVGTPPQANITQSVGFRVQLRRPTPVRYAEIEIFFYAPDGQVFRLEDSLQVPITGHAASGTWAASVNSSIDWSRGTFRFRAAVGIEKRISGALKAIDDPVARTMRRIHTDGFDR